MVISGLWMVIHGYHCIHGNGWWLYTVIHDGYRWLYMVMDGYTWLSLVIHGYTWL